MADPVWNIQPEFAVVRRGVRRGTSTPAAGGFVSSRQLVDRELPVYVLRWSKTRTAVIDAIEVMWQLTFRGVLPVLYTPPSESQVRARMVGPLAFQLTGPLHGDIEVQLEVLR